MAAYDLEEQEQIAEVRAWWKQYGNLLLNVVTVVAVTAAAWGQPADSLAPAPAVDTAGVAAGTTEARRTP